jgi:segregation and condensation protein A
MSQYRVDLEVFAGPLDLLLYLVRKDEVDIYDIQIANIAEQYIKYVDMLQMFDIDLAGDFLVMAATLMEIKSAMLLPKVQDETGDDEEATGDPRMELVRQLLEYKKFKDAANLLDVSAEKRLNKFSSPDTIIVDLKDSIEPELDIEQINIWNLLEAFDSMMQSIGKYQSYDQIKDDTPIDFYQVQILHQLQVEGPTSFQKIFEGRQNKLVMVGLFLAMLELIRYKLIWAEQNEQLGQIYIKAMTEEPAKEAVHNTIFADTNLENKKTDQPENTDEQLLFPKIPIQEIPSTAKNTEPSPQANQ